MPNLPIPSLIIGLGGTGALTVMHVKQQLLNIYSNQIPDSVGLLVFDTAQEPLAQFKTGGAVRDEGQGFGAIQFSQREQGHLGGDARTLVENIANDPRYKHMANWFKADYYLRQTKRDLFHLQAGAGMYRQFGRLALFKDVQAPGTSQFYLLVNGKIRDIQAEYGAGRSLAVFIVGSLAGGTGAGLFLDTAHLVRQIAKGSGFDVQLRGYFFLPETFQATLNTTQVADARGRAFGALRELSRFVLHDDYALGYQIPYHSQQATDHPELWRARLKDKLYDLVYLIDGHSAEGTPMRNYAISKGVTPSVADAILSFIDSNAGEYQRAYVVNINQSITNQQLQKGNEPYVGAMGTYTIVLPIQQLLEDWAYRLGKETMTTLLAPAGLDRSTALPTGLRADQNQEREHTPVEEVEALFRDLPVEDPREPGKQVLATRLWTRLHDWYRQIAQTSDRNMVRNIAAMDAESWLDALRVGASGAMPTTARADRQIQRALDVTIEEAVRLSNETEPRGDVSVDYRRIRTDTDNFFNRYLGNPADGGRREGGQFREALEIFMNFQMTRFRSRMEAYTMQQLNGANTLQPAMARKGKLGWTLGVYDELENLLNEVLTLIRAVKNDRGVVLERGDTLQMLNEAFDQMRDERDQMPRVRVPGAVPGAIKAQQEFRAAAATVFEMHRTEIARDAVERVIEMMLIYVTHAKQQLEEWAKVLGLHHEGLYAQMYYGGEQVRVERDEYKDIPCRNVIDDPAWEEERYAFYMETNNAASTALQNLHWITRIGTDPSGRPVMGIELWAGDEQLRDDYSGEWAGFNAQALLRMCREVFETALERESVLHYLAEQYKDRTAVLAGELHQKSRVMLNFDEVSAGSHLPAVYLLAFQDARHADDTTFLARVMGDLRAAYKIGETDETRARTLLGDDRFRLTVVSMEEVVPLPTLKSYIEAEQVYMNAATTQRELFHVFPAEMQIVRYEDQLSRVLNQSRRVITPHVAVMLEDMDLFKRFHALMAHGIITMDRDYMDEASTHFVYYLTTSPIDPNSQEDEEWWLTQPSTAPSLLDAMTTFIFRKGDHGKQAHMPGFTNPIDYAHVERFLLDIRQYDTDQRIEEGHELAPGDAELQDLLAQYEPDSREFGVLARIIVERDVLSEHEATLHGEMERVQRELETRAAMVTDVQRQDQFQQQDLIDLYDLYAISIVVVSEMIAARRQDALIAAGSRRGMDRR